MGLKSADIVVPPLRSNSNMRRFTTIIFACCLISAELHAQRQLGTAHISGRVWNANNEPVLEARVRIFPLEVAWSGPMPISVTDEQGFYHLDLPAIGKSRVLVIKETAGYPDTSIKICASGQEHEPEVLLFTGAVLTNVDIHLGKPDGSLQVNIVDHDTGAPIHGARVVLRRKDDPSIFYSDGINKPTITLSLPDKAITIEVSAPGFSTWKFTDTSTQHDYLEVSPEKHLTVTASLIPKDQTPP
jgi:hypothetical protein